MENNFSTYYSSEGSLIWGGYFSSGERMGKGGVTEVTPKYKMRDRVKPRANENFYYKEENRIIPITTEDVGVIKYRDSEENNKANGRVGYFVKFRQIPNYIYREESSIMPASGREVLYRKIITLTKHQIEVKIENIPTIRDWDTLEVLHNVPVISISSKKWVGYYRSYAHSETIEKIEEKYPKNKTLLKIASIYREYNFSDFNAGTKRQCEAIKKGESVYEDRGYKYGTDWLYKPVPASVVEELKVLSEQLNNEFMEKGGNVVSISIPEIETKIEKLKESHDKVWTKSFEKEISPLIIQKAKEIAIKHPKLTKISVGMGTARMDGKIEVLDEDDNKMVFVEYNEQDEEVQELLQLLSNLQREDYGYPFDDIDLNKLRKEKRLEKGGEAGEDNYDEIMKLYAIIQKIEPNTRLELSENYGAFYHNGKMIYETTGDMYDNSVFLFLSGTLAGISIMQDR